jgi:hypothetical protein
VSLSKVASSFDEQSPQPFRTEWQIKKMTLKHYGSVRSLLQAHALPSKIIKINSGIRAPEKMAISRLQV